MFLYLYIPGTVPLTVKVDARTLGTWTCQQAYHFFIPQSKLTAMDVGLGADIYRCMLS